MLPYGRQSIDESDIDAVVDVLRSDWLTTGPRVDAFEQSVCNHTGASYAVAVSSGTAALHTAMYAIGIESGDEVVVTPMTFAASANCILYQGGTPVFADIEKETFLLDPRRVEEMVSSRTKAILAVDYAGQPCDYDTLREIADRHNLMLVADACHSLGGQYKGRSVGTLADLTVFSFHPVKHITTGEGGMITTSRSDLAARMRTFRNHGITTDHRQRQTTGSWFYEMVELGYNYRITDFQCALGVSQLKKINAWVERRRAIAQRYDEAFQTIPGVETLTTRPGARHAYHLYVVMIRENVLGLRRQEAFDALRAASIGVNVHYIPVHLHPYYRKRFGCGPGQCPVAEACYERCISLPMFPAMRDEDVDRVVEVIRSLGVRNPQPER